MEIVGTVVSVKENTATVAVKRVSACGENCANCKGACETTTAVSVVENTIGAAVGDTVKIESDSFGVLRAAAVLYIVPVVVTILAAVVAYACGLSDVLSTVLSVAAFFICFTIIKIFEKKLVPKSCITKVLGRSVK